MQAKQTNEATRNRAFAAGAIFTLCAPLLCAGGCGDVPLGEGEGEGEGEVDELGLPPASDFSCDDLDDLDGSEAACLDWNDTTTPGLEVEGGRWEVRGGMIVGFGPDSPSGDCTASLMSHALVPAVTAQDQRVRARLSSLARVDKVITLRSVDPANRVQVNFRATDTDGSYGDLMVQEIRDCVFTVFTGEGEIPIPHALGEAIDVELELVGTRLMVQVDGQTVFEREVPVVERAGQIGFGIIDRSTTVFDDVVMTSLDPLP